jgi:tetratricopeptide (TPR) repeat protein
MLYKDGLDLRKRNRMGVWIPGLALAAVACLTQTLGAQITQAANTTAQPSPTRLLSLAERGDIFMARKMYRDAIDTYKQAPVSAQMLNKIGIAYHQLAELDTAAKYYQRAFKADPTFSDAINNLGTIYYSKKSFRRAVGEFKKVLRLRPDAAATWANLANAYFERKQYELSSESLQKALALDPGVLENRGTVGSLVQDRNVADRAKYHYYLAKSFAKNGKNADALQYIRKALEEGFKDRQKFLEEPEFAALRDDPDFKLLMATEPKVL